MRRHEPGQLYLVTTRCHQARFFLRPDAPINEAVLEWLARAQLHFPRLRILAVCVLSNHLHLVVRDEKGELAPWASYFLGHLARAINRHRKRRGTFFERRYSAEPILDDEALLDRLVYVVANPVQARLCKRVRDWPGVVLFAAGDHPREIPVSWVDRDDHRRARLRARPRGQSAPRDDAFQVDGRLIIDPLFSGNGPRTGDGHRVPAAIKAREHQLATERRQAGRKTLTRKQVLAQSWRSAPRDPKRSPRPVCHAADPGVRRQFRQGFHEFVSLFREASERLRGGEANVSFPDWCYPPGRSLIRSAIGGTVASGAG